MAVARKRQSGLEKKSHVSRALGHVVLFFRKSRMVGLPSTEGW